MYYYYLVSLPYLPIPNGKNGNSTFSLTLLLIHIFAMQARFMFARSIVLHVISCKIIVGIVSATLLANKRIMEYGSLNLHVFLFSFWVDYYEWDVFQIKMKINNRYLLRHRDDFKIIIILYTTQYQVGNVSS